MDPVNGYSKPKLFVKEQVSFKSKIRLGCLSLATIYFETLEFVVASNKNGLLVTPKIIVRNLNATIPCFPERSLTHRNIKKSLLLIPISMFKNASCM